LAEFKKRSGGSGGGPIKLIQGIGVQVGNQGRKEVFKTIAAPIYGLVNGEGGQSKKRGDERAYKRRTLTKFVIMKEGRGQDSFASAGNPQMETCVKSTVGWGGSIGTSGGLISERDGS